MSTVLTLAVDVDPIEYVADRCASREVDALFDFWSIGRLVATNELAYDDARDRLVAAFTARNLAASTAKVYLSQGAALGSLFESFDDVEEFADDECGGSRSLKRIYDQTRKAAKSDEAESDGGEGEAEAAVPMPVVDVILSMLPNVKDAADLRRIADAVAERLVPQAIAV